MYPSSRLNHKVENILKMNKENNGSIARPINILNPQTNNNGGMKNAAIPNHLKMT
jgi:hypothetical protein